MVVATNLVKVPALTGLPVRKVIESAGENGFDVQITGTGTSREQMPAAS